MVNSVWQSEKHLLGMPRQIFVRPSESPAQHHTGLVGLCLPTEHGADLGLSPPCRPDEHLALPRALWLPARDPLAPPEPPE